MSERYDDFGHKIMRENSAPANRCAHQNQQSVRTRKANGETAAEISQEERKRKVVFL